MEADLGDISSSSSELSEEKSENLNEATSEQHQDGYLGETSSLRSSSSRPEHLGRRFPLGEILQATNNFDDMLVIGKGGFGKVYKGMIDDGAVTVAMKRLKPMSKQGAPQFWTEVDLVSRFRHSHLVSIIGYCDDHSEMILVYEYMPRGSLSDILFRAHLIDHNEAVIKLSWVQRLKICIGAAQGLDYLHTGTGINSRVIHRDVKSSNILLDDSLAAKVSDFGLSKVGPANQDLTHVSTNFKGTFGYVDPEYMHTGRLTRKSDVYSFGVVLLEVLSGKRAMDPKLCQEHWGLSGWAKDCVKKGEPYQIIDPYLKYEINTSSLKEFVQITEKCLHYRSRKRPTMAEVVASLEHVLALQERTDSSMLEEDFKNLGWMTLDNQENLDDSLEINDNAINNEVIDDAGNSEPLDYASSVQSHVGSSGLGLGLLLPGGHGLGAVYGELWKVVIDYSRASYVFKSKLDHIKMTLAALKPKIDRIAETNIDLNHSNDDIYRFVEKLVAGKRLIVKCSKINRWNVVGKQEYSRKLTAFRESLLWFMQVDMQADLVLDTKKILLEVDSIHYKLDTIHSLSKNGSGVGYCNVPGLPDLIVGLYEPLMKLKKMILDDGVSMVVLSAPGGTGKTTLSKMLCKDKEIQGIYGSNTLFVTVAQASLKDIVSKIFQHYGFSLPLFQKDEDLMNQLECLMRQVVAGRPILIVFDDVWSEWHHHIQNFNFGMENFKILVTSRFVFPKCDRKYKLNKLSRYDATTLFCHSALRNSDNSEIPDELVSEIVKGCRGSPLALTVVGRSLYNQPVVIWKNTVKRWSEGESIFNSNKKELLLPLQTSLDAFEENDIAKDCYMDLVLFPEDQLILLTLLVDMWVELYGKDDDDILEILLKLSFRNLVNLLPMRKDTIEVDGYCNEYYVMNHDLYRELAIYRTNQECIKHRRRLFLEIKADSHPKWCIEQQQQPNCARLVYISTDETFKSTWYNIQLPLTEVLILNFSSMKYALPPFIKTMNKLKVIILTNYGSFPVELNNFHILTHSYNLKRIRFHRISIPSLATSLIQLDNLQKISFTRCEIGNAFASCTSETANIFPNLTELEIDYSDDLVEFPVGLCNILCLRKLSITHCGELIAFPDEFGRLVNMERLWISSCAKLEELPESICGLHELTFLDISGCTQMSRLPEHIGKLKKLKVLRMGCVGEMQDIPTSVEDLRELKNVVCDEEISYKWKNYEGQISNLKVSVIKEDANADGLHNA